MATEVPNDGTLFMFDDGFIPLPDLESWYAQGHVTPNDIVRIFEKDKQSYAMKISSLIEIYGAEFPFRRIPKNSGDSESPKIEKSEDAETRNRKKSEDVKIPKPSETGRPIITSENPTVIPKKVGGAFGSKRPVTPPPPPPEVKEEEKVEEKKEEFVYLDYPLYNVDNEPESERITGQEVLEEMEKLKLQFAFKRFSDRYTEFFWFINRRKRGDREEVAICRLCNYTPYSPRIFFLHLFNNYHILELSKNQVSRKSFDYWSRQFEALKDVEKEERDKKQAEELKEKKERKMENLKKLENSGEILKTKMPETSTSSEVKNLEVKTENSPRVPLFDPPLAANSVKVSQQEFVNFIKSLSKAMENLAAKAIAQNKVVNWKCGYCSSSRTSVTVVTELDAFNHLMSQKHKEKMKFTAPPDDLLYWGNWAIEINKQIEHLQNPEIQKVSEDVKKNQESPKPTTAAQKPSTSSTDSTRKSPEKTSKAPSFASTIANVPRVPMLDQMPGNNNLVTKQKFNEILDQCSEIYQKDRKRLSAAKFEPKHWNCTYCSTEQRVMKPSNMQDVLLHIVKEGHREKMQYKATLSDLMYWKTWAEEYGISPKILEQKKLAEIQKVAEEKGVKKPVITAGAEKMNPFKKGLNNPRIPLLDVPKCAHHMKRDHFNTRYQSLCNQLKTRESGPETEKAVQCMCYHCPGDTRITTVYQMLQHIFNGQHDRYIHYSATSSDFLHHERIIQRMPFSPEFVAAASSPDAVKKTPVSVVNPLPQVALSTPETPKTPQISLLNQPLVDNVRSFSGGTEKNEPFKKGCNIPRVTLLDVPKDQNRLMREVLFRERYISLREQLKTRKSGPETERTVQCICYHCPGYPQITTVYGILQHIFNGQHDRYIQFSAVSSDFDYWENLIRRMPLNPEALVAAISSPDAVKRTPVSVVNPLPPVAVCKPETPTPSKPATSSPVPNAVAPSKTVSPAARIPSADSCITVYRPSKPQPVPLPRVTSAPAPPVTRAVPQASTVPPAVRTAPLSAPTRIPCTLPLFGRRAPVGSFSNPWGPTNQQISFVNREWRMRLGTTPFFNNGTYCSLCNKDMSFWTFLEVVRHAFSVQHLSLYGRPENIDQYGLISEDGYKFWIQKMLASCYVEHAPVSNICFVSHLEVRSHGPAFYDDVFTGFTPNQKEVIANVDVEKLNTCAYLLLHFGGCIYCKKWLLTGTEVYDHWKNDSHMSKIRQNHEVGKCAMNVFVRCLEQCQKDKSRCSIM